MCGIAGIVHFDGRPADERRLAAMIGGLSHRGPDGTGVVCRDNVGLAHARLAIIDPAGGQQPMRTADGNVILSYNGEVYNYREIRDRIGGGEPFRTHSDTEVVLRAYQRWDIDCLEQFRGMFAMAVYDVAAGKLFLVRDRVGIKPLYYHHDGKRLVFCSELLPMINTGAVPRQIDPNGLAGYLRYQYVPAPHSIYRNVHKLEPGCLLQVDVETGEMVSRRYWNFQPSPIDMDEPEALEQFNTLLDETIGMYVRSDVPFGSFLSGGVDSSLVTAVMRDRLGEGVQTYSIGYREREHSELPYAAEASRVLKTVHHERVVRPQLDEDFLPMLCRHFGEPFADSSAIPTYWVAQTAAAQVKMVLSGDGGDELFGGYDSYGLLFRRAQNPLHPAGRLLMKLLSVTAPVERIRRAATIESLNSRRRHQREREIFSPAELNGLLLIDARITDPDLSIGTISADPLIAYQWHDFNTYLVDDVLTKVDRMSMANSLEVRVPLLDHKIVEAAFSLPLTLRIRRSENRSTKRHSLLTKYLLRKSAARYFPASYLNRPKKGFGIPVLEWCRGPWRDCIRDGLENRRNPIFDWIDFRRAGRLLERFFAGEDVFGKQVWSLFMLHLWAENVHCVPSQFGDFCPTDENRHLRLRDAG